MGRLNIESLSDGSGLEDGAVTTAKVADGAVTFGKIDRTTDEYSTSEVAVGQWVDGKTIYRKSFSGTTALPPTHGITGIDSVLRVEAMVKDVSGAWRPIPWAFNAGSYAAADPWQAGVGVTATTFSWQLGSAIGSYVQNRVTLYYTK